MLDDKDIDAIMIATCNHWHAPATIMACSAGKHVYVEKPGSHNPHEGEMMVAAARMGEQAFCRCILALGAAFALVMLFLCLN